MPKIVDAKSRVAKPTDAKNKVYRRVNRPDLLTLVEMTQLDKIKIAAWEKEIRDWKLDVGCWMLDVGCWKNPSVF